MKTALFMRNRRGQRGITGLETAIILIAFVVVASVFAYTVLSSGLFSTQKAQEAVYGGLSEAQSTLQLKGAVVSNGLALLNSNDYPEAWTSSANLTMSRETTVKMEGSASLKGVVGELAALNETLIVHEIQPMALANGDTLSFFIRIEGTIDTNISFVLASGADLQANATQTYAITNGGNNWKQHVITLTGGTNHTATHYGIILTNAAATGTLHLDNIRFESVDAYHGEAVPLSNCDYPNGWVADSNATLSRETTDKMEGLASAKVVIGAAIAGPVIYHAMHSKAWTSTDYISVWIKVESAGLDDQIQFVLAEDAAFATITHTETINNVGNGWEKHSIEINGVTNADAAFYGIFVANGTATGTFYLDAIEISANLADNNDPMVAYANQLVFAVGNALGGEPVDFTSTVDSKQTGIISDETNKYHKVVISYSDSFSQVTDLAWTMQPMGKSNANSLLETNEKFQIFVDLTYVNNNTGVLGHKEKLTANRTFRIEVKPHKGAVLTVERTLPIRIRNVMSLD